MKIYMHKLGKFVYLENCIIVYDIEFHGEDLQLIELTKFLKNMLIIQGYFETSSVS